MEAEIERDFSTGESYNLHSEFVNKTLIGLEVDFRNIRDKNQNSLDARIDRQTILTELENIKRTSYKQLELITFRYPIKNKTDEVKKIGERLDILEKGIKTLEI